MNAGWVKNIKYTAVPVLSEFQTKTFKQYKQWSSGFHMLQRANLLYAKELRRVALEIGGTLKEGQMDSRLVVCIGNFCKTLEIVADSVSSCWQDFASMNNPYHEYISSTDAKEKDIEKKRQKCTKSHKEMEQKLDAERKKYERSFQQYRTTLEKMSRTKEEEMTRIDKSTLNQAHSRMDVACTKYQSTNKKETQKKEDFKEEMQKLRMEWLQNEHRKLQLLLLVFEDTIERMARTTHNVSSGSSLMFEDCVAGFKDVDIDKVVETSLRQKEKQCVLHEYMTDDGTVTVERNVFKTKAGDDSKKTSAESKEPVEWPIYHPGNMETIVTPIQNPGDNKHNFGDSDVNHKRTPRRRERFQSERGRWFEESP